MATIFFQPHSAVAPVVSSILNVLHLVEKRALDAFRLRAARLASLGHVR